MQYLACIAYIPAIRYRGDTWVIFPRKIYGRNVTSLRCPFLECKKVKSLLSNSVFFLFRFSSLLLYLLVFPSRLAWLRVGICKYGPPSIYSTTVLRILLPPTLLSFPDCANRDGGSQPRPSVYKVWLLFNKFPPLSLHPPSSLLRNLFETQNTQNGIRKRHSTQGHELQLSRINKVLKL